MTAEAEALHMRAAVLDDAHVQALIDELRARGYTVTPPTGKQAGR